MTRIAIHPQRCECWDRTIAAQRGCSMCRRGLRSYLVSDGEGREVTLDARDHGYADAEEAAAIMEAEIETENAAARPQQGG